MKQEIILKTNFIITDKVSICSNIPYDQKLFLKFIKYLLEKGLLTEENLLKIMPIENVIKFLQIKEKL